MTIYNYVKSTLKHKNKSAETLLLKKISGYKKHGIHNYLFNSKEVCTIIKSLTGECITI